MEIIKKTITQEFSISGADFSGEAISVDGNLIDLKIKIAGKGAVHHIDLCSEQQVKDLAKELTDLILFLNNKSDESNLNVSRTIFEEYHDQ